MCAVDLSGVIYRQMQRISSSLEAINVPIATGVDSMP
jgi:hypothetical protein